MVCRMKCCTSLPVLDPIAVLCCASSAGGLLHAGASWIPSLWRLPNVPCGLFGTTGSLGTRNAHGLLLAWTRYSSLGLLIIAETPKHQGVFPTVATTGTLALHPLYRIRRRPQPPVGTPVYAECCAAKLCSPEILFDQTVRRMHFLFMMRDAPLFHHL